MVGASDGHGELGSRALASIHRLTVALPEGSELQRVPGSDDLGQSPAQGDDPVGSLAVQGDGAVAFIGERPADQTAQHGAGAHLDEGSDAGLAQALQQINEANGPRDLLG